MEKPEELSNGTPERTVTTSLHEALTGGECDPAASLKYVVRGPERAMETIYPDGGVLRAVIGKGQRWAAIERGTHKITAYSTRGLARFERITAGTSRAAAEYRDGRLASASLRTGGSVVRFADSPDSGGVLTVASDDVPARPLATLPLIDGKHDFAVAGRDGWRLHSLGHHNGDRILTAAPGGGQPGVQLFVSGAGPVRITHGASTEMPVIAVTEETLAAMGHDAGQRKWDSILAAGVTSRTVVRALLAATAGRILFTRPADRPDLLRLAADSGVASYAPPVPYQRSNVRATWSDSYTWLPERPSRAVFGLEARCENAAGAAGGITLRVAGGGEIRFTGRGVSYGSDSIELWPRALLHDRRLEWNCDVYGNTAATAGFAGGRVWAVEDEHSNKAVLLRFPHGGHDREVRVVLHADGGALLSSGVDLLFPVVPPDDGRLAANTPH